MEICKKQAQKTSKIQLKQAQKQANCKPSRKPANPQKNKPKFAEKTQGWQHCRFLFVCTRDDHYPVCRLDIQRDSEFETGYRFPKTAILGGLELCIGGAKPTKASPWQRNCVAKLQLAL